MALSLDLRRRIIDAYDNGEGTQARLACRFKVGKATVERLVRLRRETGSVEPRPHGGTGPLITADDRPGLLDAAPLRSKVARSLVGWLSLEQFVTQFAVEAFNI